MDPNHGRFYYYNRTTGETSWTAPPGTEGAPAAPAAPMASQQQHQPQQQQQSHQNYQSNGHSAGPDRSHRDPSPPPKTLGAKTADVHVTGATIKPWLQFEDCRFPSQIMRALTGAGFPAPSAIQAWAWPILSEGRDLIGVAKTGSGKTLGFLIPACSIIIEKRMDPQRAGGPLQLVLAPTRELACQIEVEAEKFGTQAGMNCAVAYGGAPKGPQLQQLRRGAHVLIATPGRLNDFVQQGVVRLRSVVFLVLDEADRMLDMGFEPQIRQIIGELPRQRQTMMFTATWPKEVRRLAEEFLYQPAHVQIGSTDALEANADIDQRIIIVASQWDKQDKLLGLLKQEAPRGERVIVFTATKRGCDQLARELENRSRISCVCIHGDREQRERDAALEAFKSGRSPIMVATDVAARGLDIKHVKLVVNFDPANNAEDYVHRIGRTGRAGDKGLAYTFLTGDQGRAASFFRFATCVSHPSSFSVPSRSWGRRCTF